MPNIPKMKPISSVYEPIVPKIFYEGEQVPECTNPNLGHNWGHTISIEGNERWCDICGVTVKRMKRPMPELVKESFAVLDFVEAELKRKGKPVDPRINELRAKAKALWSEQK